MTRTRIVRPSNTTYYRQTVREEEVNINTDCEYEFTFKGVEYVYSVWFEINVMDYWINEHDPNPHERDFDRKYDLLDLDIECEEFFMDGEEIERAEFWERLKESKQTECTSLDEFIEGVIEERIEEYDNN